MDIKISVEQVEVIPGRPDINLKNIKDRIRIAKSKDVDLVVFSEMVVPGYLLGDEWENKSFVEEVTSYNKEILKHTKGIAVIWGNLKIDKDKVNEDGRVRKYNVGFIAQNQKYINNGVFDGYTLKTLMPKYREFDDERHFYSMIKLADELNLDLNDMLKPFTLKIKGKDVKIGIILCEDMWIEDYNYNPTQILTDNGAQLVINLSASPWSWQKNAKRHSVVRKLLENNNVPFIYCNNTGIQNNGKNIFLFDGSSTAYNPDGSIKLCAECYKQQSLLIDMQKDERVEDTKHDRNNDVEELYNGLTYGIKKFFEKLPNKKVVIGISGGVDSALSATLLVDALGAENVYGVNMPSVYNSELTKNAALKLSENLGINYTTVPIQESVDLTNNQLSNSTFKDSAGNVTKLNVDAFSLENIQARDRGSRVLSALSGILNCVYTNNGNKTETALGYCTLYGDVNGAIAPLGDLYKWEVYELARYINEKNNKEIIPSEIIEVVPSAELSDKQDVTKGLGDPIIYPYHDQLIRAFVEFRMDPEEILENYKNDTLDNLFKLEKGTIRTYFKTDEQFIDDLEHKWELFKINIFKRIQSPPNIVVSRRAFGYDLRESQNGIHFTKNYQKLKKKILKNKTS